MTRGPDRLDDGTAAPLGAVFDGNGVNFSLFSHHAEKIELCLFDEAGEQEIRRYLLPQRTGDIWHGYLEGARPGLLYGYRVYGPYDPVRGHRFNSNKLLIDPYAKALFGSLVYDEANYGYRKIDRAQDLSYDDRDNARHIPKCRVIAYPDEPSPSARPHIPWKNSILYELHVRGYTKQHPDVAAELRGTFAGLAATPVIDHLLNLGITTVELLPVHAFSDERHLVQRGLTNYWGYNSLNCFCPEPRYLATGKDTEIRDTVDKLHAAGIEVILDVVYNHTGEGDELGPTLSFRGIDNASYYQLAPDSRYYVNNSGCGNTLNFAHPQIRQMVIDSLVHWAEQFDVDGFRFDLAVSLGRDPDLFDGQSAMLSAIHRHPSLSKLKLIAEPWDVGPQGHQTGNFPPGWAEWNDHYRDCIRRAWRGDAGVLGELATRMTGSSDIFGNEARGPLASLNYVTCHDGFTLEDLVSYSTKHNEANQENNHDGPDENFSWNCGEEGPSTEPHIQSQRQRQKRSLLATLLLSQGVPMLLAGDEFGRTQKGNNNAYCQDNELSWVKWKNRESDNLDLLNFLKAMIRLRLNFPVLRRDTHLTGHHTGAKGHKDITWLHPDGHEMTIGDWKQADAHILGFHLASARDCKDDLIILMNMGEYGAPFTLPEEFREQNWYILLNTGQSNIDEPSFPMPKDLTLEPHSLIVASPRQRDASLFELARRAGIADHYWDITGGFHKTGIATARALLGKMGYQAETPDEVANSLTAFEDSEWQNILPSTLVVKVDKDIDVPISAQSGTFKGLLFWEITTEQAARLEGQVQSEELPILQRTQRKGGCWERRCLKIAPPLPLGYHKAVLSGAIDAEMMVIVVPERCYLPSSITEGRKFWGLTVQLYSLRSENNWGMGDFHDLEQLAIWAGCKGASTVVLNPLHALFPHHPDSASPYFPSSRSFLNPLYLSVSDLPDFEKCTDVRNHLSDPAVASKLASLRDQDWINYTDVGDLKYDLIQKLYVYFLNHHLKSPEDEVAQAFHDFCEEGGQALKNFAAFEILANHFGTPVWTNWPAEYRNPDSQAISAFVNSHPEEFEFCIYCQWQADAQLARAASEAKQAGMVLGLCRDLAVGCSAHGADGWRHQNVYTETARLGAPPDPFNPSGQNWGVAPTNPHSLKAQGYAPFTEVLRANMRHAGILRIDHVMGIARQFWIPGGHGSKEGTYIEYPFDDLIGILALESQRNRCMIIGEDLGTVPDGFRERMAAANVLSSRVLYFEQEKDHFRAPDDYPLMAAACLSTHDLPTLLGYWQGSDLDEMQKLNLYPSVEVQRLMEDGRIRDKAALVSMLQSQGFLNTHEHRNADWSRIWDAVHGFLAGTKSVLALVQLDDLTDETVQINLPGTSDHQRPNWRRRQQSGLQDMVADIKINKRLNLMLRIRPGIKTPGPL